MARRKENQMTIEERIEQLDKFNLELILLTLVDVDKNINVGTRVKREIMKAYEKELLGAWG
jgi:hypothetical protein